MSPKLLLLDEPSSSLDRESERALLKVIGSLPRELPIVMVSHNPDDFGDFDTVYVCEQGRLKKRVR